MTAFDLPHDLIPFYDSALHSCEAAAGSALSEALAAVAGDGLTSMLAPEPLGLGMPVSHALPILRAAGRARLQVPLHPVLAASDLLADAGSDIAEAALAGAELLTAAPVADLAVSSGRVSGRALQVPLADIARWLVVPAGEAMVIVQLSSSNALMHLSSDFDVARPAFTVDLDAQPLAIVDDPVAVAEYHARDLTFRAAEAAAAAGSAMEQAITYLTNRTQFGQPLSAFQTLRHGLARARMELHSLDRLILAAVAADPGEPRLARAEMAYARAAADCPSVIEMALHMHGGMGYTWDVPVHLYLRRVRMLFGPRPAAWADGRIAARLLDRDSKELHMSVAKRLPGFGA